MPRTEGCGYSREGRLGSGPSPMSHSCRQEVGEGTSGRGHCPPLASRLPGSATSVASLSMLPSLLQVAPWSSLRSDHPLVDTLWPSVNITSMLDLSHNEPTALHTAGFCKGTKATG